jgi:hypothetical protein
MNEVEKNTQQGKKPNFLGTPLIIFFVLGVIFISFEVLMISKHISALRISDDKMEYVYQKVNDLVNVLNTKETSGVNYNPVEKYDFKPAETNELIPETTVVEDDTPKILKEQLSKMKDGEKLKLVRDRLVDIYQKSKERDDDLTKLKQSFYETKTSIENWYYDKKNIKAPSAKKDAADIGIVDKLKQNLNNYIQISEVGENLANGNKKILDIDKIPEMLSYAEILIEAGSLSQAAWILEDIQSVTKQSEIQAFTAGVEAYIGKYPNANLEVQKIKELIEILENKD